MMTTNYFRNIGSRNKACMWEYLTACAYKDLEVPGSAYKISQLFSYGAGESNQNCLSLYEMSSLAELMKKEFESGSYTEKFFQKLIDSYRKPFLEFKRLISGVKLQDLTDSELFGLYDKFHLSAEWTYPAMLIGFFAAFIDDYFTEKLKKASKAEGIELMNLKTMLLTMPKASISEREEKAITDLLRDIKSNNLPLSHRRLQLSAKKLSEDFGWFHMEYAGEPRGPEHYLKLIEKRMALPLPEMDVSTARKAIIEKQREFFKRVGNREIEDLTFAMQEFTFILDDSKAYTINNHYLAFPIIKDISRRLDIPYSDLYYLVRHEIEAALKAHSFDRKIIEERKKFRVVFLKDGKIEVFSGAKAKDMAEMYIEKEEGVLDQEIKGITAYPGFYKGKVTVVLNPNDHGKFKDGDVLVTRDGSAEFTYFLQHAGAIVADQGGIISHAAIVARESRVPAILSTKIGTKILRDGDIVEVDATKGTVEIIEKAKK